MRWAFCWVILSLVSGPMAFANQCADLFNAGTDASKGKSDVIQIESAQREVFQNALAKMQEKPTTENLLELASKYKFTEKELFDLAMLAAENDQPFAFSIEDFNFTDQNILFELALKVAKNNPSAVLINIDDFKLKSKARLTALAKVILEKDPSLLSAVIRNFKLQKPTAITLLQKYSTYLSVAEIFHVMDASMSMTISISEVQDVLRKFAENYPGVLPASWVDMSWDRFKSREIGIMLYDQAIKLFIKGQPVPVTSLELFSAVTGLDYAALSDKRVSQEYLGKLALISLLMQKELTAPVFNGVNFDNEVFAQSKLKSAIELMSSLNSLRILEHATESQLQTIMTELGMFDHAITINKLDSIVIKIKKRTLEILFKDNDLGITVEEYESLEKQWDGVEPLISLLANYSDDKELTAILKRILQTSINGTFTTYKFFGYKGDARDIKLASAQMAMLDEAGKKEWMKRRIKVKLFDSIMDEAAMDGMQSQRDGFFNKVDFRADSDISEERLNAVPFEIKNTIIEQVVNPSMHPQAATGVFMVLISAGVGNQSDIGKLQIIKDILADALRNEPDFKRVKKIADFLWFMTEQYRQTLVPQEKYDVFSADLTEIRAWFHGKNISNSKKTIIISGIFSDPKLLVTVGDLVECISCMSINGFQAFAIPAYVVDANIQAMASFVLNAGNFENQKQFDEVVNGISSGNIQVNFDGNRKVAVFYLNGKTIHSLPIEYAYLRQMLKLGRASKGKGYVPGLVLENAYDQDHPAMSMMVELHNELLSELAVAIGGVTDKKIFIPRTRNPDGVHTDLNSDVGLANGSYSIEPLSSDWDENL